MHPPLASWLAVLSIGCGTAGATPPDAGPAAAAVCVAPKEPERLGHARFGEPHRRATSDDACGVADNNLGRAEAAVLALPAPRPAAPQPAWDHRTPLARLGLITRRFGLDDGEQRRLARDGMVVAARLVQPSYAWAYHDIYQSQLPVFISLDSILHAVFAAHDGIVRHIEEDELAPRLRALLTALHCQLPIAARTLPGEVARDLDVYLVVARTLLGHRVASALGDAGVERDARELVARADAAAAMATVPLFGRDRVIDFTQFRPRSHYTGDLAPYFRSVMWLSRLEFNLVSRSSRSSAPGELDPRETPREDLDALALAELVDASGKAGELERIDQVFALLAGRREDVPAATLVALARKAGIADLRAPDAAARMRAVIDDGFRRTARIHYMPEGASELPAIATLIGPRITPDTAALRPLMHGETPGRNRMHAGDLAYVVGNDRGLAYLGDDLTAFPGLHANLDRARGLLAAAPRGDDLYTAWLDAIRALARPTEGAAPSFMATQAYADLRLDTTIAAYGQLRHNHALIAGQPYGEGGCQIPDGYVEPAPEVYDALARYADLGARQIGKLSPAAASRDYFVRLAAIARVLAAISRIELAGQPLPDAAQRFLGMVAEIEPYGSDGRPTYTGWYFDLFIDREDAISRADFIADYATSTSGVGYVGAQSPVLGIFAVDGGGKPRAMIGPIARAYEHWASGPRLDDDASTHLAAAARVAPWAARYTAPAPPKPPFEVQIEPGDDDHRYLVVKAPRALGALTVETLDHHRLPVQHATRRIAAGTTRFRFDPKLETARGTLRFTVGRWSGYSELHCMDGCWLSPPE
jgi:hypothetical protein